MNSAGPTSSEGWTPEALGRQHSDRPALHVEQHATRRRSEGSDLGGKRTAVEALHAEKTTAPADRADVARSGGPRACARGRPSGRTRAPQRSQRELV